MRPHREAELSVETGVEFGQRTGVGLVEAVLETSTVHLARPIAVDVIVDEPQRCNLFVEYPADRHRLQAIRNLSAASAAVRPA